LAVSRKVPREMQTFTVHFKEEVKREALDVKERFLVIQEMLRKQRESLANRPGTFIYPKSLGDNYPLIVVAIDLASDDWRSAISTVTGVRVLGQKVRPTKIANVEVGDSPEASSIGREVLRRQLPSPHVQGVDERCVPYPAPIPRRSILLCKPENVLDRCRAIVDRLLHAYKTK
jgi:hypothetical protein